MSSGFDQEFYVFLLKKNPSGFKERKYCPDTYKEIIVKDEVIGMCPDLPVERLKSEGIGSDQELIDELNFIYRNAGLATRFEATTRAQFHYADTVGGTEPKLMTQANIAKLSQYTPFLEVLDQTPSGERQPRSIKNNAPNSLGFRRSGVWEWIKDIEWKDRGLVGGSWNYSSLFAGSYFLGSVHNTYSKLNGPARLVRME